MSAPPVEFAVIHPRSTDARWALTQYFTELDQRFEGGFDPGDALTAEADRYEAPGGAFVVARLDGRAVGCGAVLTLEPGIGEIKRMWVDSSCRGIGLGRRMLSELEQRSAALGHHTVRLDTNRVLSQAISMYRSSGYRAIERYSENPYAHHWFEKALVRGGLMEG